MHDRAEPGRTGLRNREEQKSLYFSYMYILNRIELKFPTPPNTPPSTYVRMAVCVLFLSSVHVFCECVEYASIPHALSTDHARNR